MSGPIKCAYLDLTVTVLDKMFNVDTSFSSVNYVTPDHGMSGQNIYFHSVNSFFIWDT
jgi:hypothetical protein